MKYLAAISLLGACLLAACGTKAPQPEQGLPLEVLSSGVYRAYPVPTNPKDSLLSREGQAGYEPFYISTYNRHGSRYQPNDKRYANTLRRLQEAHEHGALTPYGESLLPQIQTLCDSCLGHGGLLTTIGAKQLKGIGSRMAELYSEVFNSGKFISARASVVPRCQQSMHAFFEGLHETLGHETHCFLEVDSAYMSYIAYDTPQMRELSAKDAFWKPDFNRFYEQHTLQKSVIERIYTDASGLDSLNFIDDLYWLTIGMQNVDVPGCDLSQAMTPEELFECYRCVNYRMYICNANAPMSQHIPAESASSLLQNIVESADVAIATDTVAATLRFGHDTNLMRLLALMRVEGVTAEVEDPSEAWRVWQEAQICPMGANLQIVFYRNEPSSHEEGNDSNVVVQFRLNEKPVLLDIDDVLPIEGNYYNWDAVRGFFLQQIKTDNTKTDFIEPVQ